MQFAATAESEGGRGNPIMLDVLAHPAKREAEICCRIIL